MWEGCSSTYKLIIKDRGWAQSVFSVWDGCGGTYELIIEDGERD
jgi:hypothetical protein